jgi:hypothetical protein|tara:strand:- start:490 stop:690 length:201 start_codon:yes stop_codon:yes gene_type:complete
MDDEIAEVQASYRRLTSELILSGVDPILIAGVMSASGVRMYKANMVREEYLRMMDIIYEEAIHPND